MRKSTVFISVVLTTFVLVMLYNVASAYRQNSEAVALSTPPSATMIPTATDLPVPTEVLSITPEEAAQLAAQVVGNSNLLSAESSDINGLNAYKITFTNSDVVYIGLDGQILSVQVAPVTINVAPPAQKHKNNQNNGGNPGGNNGAQVNHESNEEHEEHED